MGLVFATTKVRAMEKELLSREFQTLLGQSRDGILASLKERGLIEAEKGASSELEASINLATMKRSVYILELCPSPVKEFLLDYYLPWRTDFYALSAWMSSVGKGSPENRVEEQMYTELEGLEEAKSPAELFELNLHSKLGDIFYELGRQKLSTTELKDIAYALLGKRLIARIEEEQDSDILEAWRLISKEMDLTDIGFIARCKSAGREVQEQLLLGAGGLISKEDMIWLSKSPDSESFLKRLNLVTTLDPTEIGKYLREMYEAAMVGEGVEVVLGFANLSLMDAALARSLLLGKSYGIDPKAIEEVYLA